MTTEQENQEPNWEIEARIKQWEAAHPQATLTEIEQAVDKALSQLRQRLVEASVQAREAARGKAEAQLCPQCGQKMMKNGQKKRVLRMKDGQKIELQREQMRCHDCGMTLFPPR
jgi:YgiT-type zinc finger domain-containing protein